MVPVVLLTLKRDRLVPLCGEFFMKPNLPGQRRTSNLL